MEQYVKEQGKIKEIELVLQNAYDYTDGKSTICGQIKDIVNNEVIIQQSKDSWDDIYKEFKASDRPEPWDKEFGTWLKKNYNVPTKK